MSKNKIKGGCFLRKFNNKIYKNQVVILKEIQCLIVPYYAKKGRNNTNSRSN